MKRIFLKLEILNSTNLLIPFDLNNKISSWIYSIVGDKMPMLHDSENPKNFCFSNISLSKKEITKNGLMLLSKNAALIVSSTNCDFITHFLESIELNSRRPYQIGDIFFKIVDIKEDSIFPTANTFFMETITPICINYKVDKKHIYINPIDHKELYIQQLKKNILSKTTIDESIDLEIISNTIKHKSIKIKNGYVKAYHFSFMVSGSPEIIKHNYYSGFGVKNSQGFGLTNILMSN